MTPSQCQKNANRDAIWVPSITRGDHFLAVLGVKECKKLILTYVAVFRGARSSTYEKFLLGDKVSLKGVLSSHKSVTDILPNNPTILPLFSVFMNFHHNLSDSDSVIYRTVTVL